MHALPLWDWRTWVVVALLALIVVAAFTPALDNGFVNWDDDKNFLDNPFYRGLGAAQLKWAWSTFWLGVYQPLAWCLFELQYVHGKLGPRGYHLTSLVLHTANTAILYFLTLSFLVRCETASLLQGPWVRFLGAGLATALFAVHPLRVEAVAWASCQPYLPCAMFSMLAVGVYLRAFSMGPLPDWRWLVGSLILFVTALLFHAAAVSLPAVLLILDGYPLRRFGEGPGRWFDGAALRIWYEKLPFLIVSLIFTVVAIAARSKALILTDQHNAFARIAQACFGTWFYVFKTVLPLNLVAVYQSPKQIDWLLSPFIESIVATAAMSLGSFLLRRRWPGLLAGWLSYVAILAPHLGIIRISEQIAADRYSYMAMLAWVVPAAACLCRLAHTSSRLRPAAVGIITLGLAVVPGLVFLTWDQCRTWRDSRTLWAHALNHGADNSSEVHNNMGVALSRQGQFEAATASYIKALRLNPQYAHARNNMGVELSRQGKYAAAAAQYAEALRLNPNYVAAHDNLGVELNHQGQFEAAAAHFGQALRLNPDYFSAYNNLGVALASMGKFEAATSQYVQSLRLNPNHGEAYNNLALIMATCPDAKYRDGAKAVELATRACELSRWKSSDFLNTLAAGCAESGDFGAAVRWQTRAIGLSSDERRNGDYQSRLESYQAKRPHRGALVGRAPTDARP